MERKFVKTREGRITPQEGAAEAPREAGTGSRRRGSHPLRRPGGGSVHPSHFGLYNGGGEVWYV